MIIASRALRPFHGSRRGVRLQPREHDVDVLRGQRVALDVVRSHGWYSSAASRPSNRPSSIMICLAAAALLGGRARGRRSRRRSSSATAASAIAAPTPDAAIVLWPQPWPRPGSASYSARIPMRGPSAAALRRGAWPGWRSPGVRPDARPRTRAPRSASATQVAAWTSSNAGSGFAWIRCDRSTISSRAASTAAASARLQVGMRLGGDGRRSGSGTHDSVDGSRMGRCRGIVQRRRRPDRSALRGEGRLGDGGEGDDEQGDRELQGAFEAAAR